MRKHDFEDGNALSGSTIDPPPFQAGDRLTREEFIHRWEFHPEIKFAELIGGVVYMPSPLTRQHGVTDNLVGGWLFSYHAETPGTEAGSNVTTFMEGEETPQPDQYLRILPEFGGRSGEEGKYLQGSPELLVEISVSSVSIDMNQKYDLYERAGVVEYLTILMYEREIRWHRLGAKGYQRIKPVSDTIWKSRVFPGLWLDGAALLASDAAAMLTTLRKGLRSPEHGTFVRKLAKRKK